jgi:hypothetical protein
VQRFEFITVSELREGDTFALNVNDMSDQWVRRTVDSRDEDTGVVSYLRGGDTVSLRRQDLPVVRVKR